MDQLFTSRSSLQSVLNALLDATAILDEVGTLVWVNSAFHDLFTSFADVIQLHVSQLIPGFDLPAIKETGEDTIALDGKGSFNLYLHPINDGGGFWMLQLRTLKPLQEAMETYNESLRIVTHDLRSPLTTISGFADMLLQPIHGQLTERQVYSVKKIIASVGQMTHIIDNLQDAGRFDLQTSFYVMHQEPIDLSDIVRRIVSSYITPPEKQSLIPQLHVHAPIPILDADSTMLERAIINLIDNAVKYTPDTGSIEIHLKQSDDAKHLILSVMDTGYGISEEDQKRIFERHVRLKRKEYRKIKGTGLGLFIVQNIMRQHGGQVKVQSQLDKGSTFSLYIPLTYRTTLT
ncbi:MAG: ATP-binding protein [Phototrophicaceae bacterium]